MIIGIAAKREDRSGLGAVVRAQATLTKVAIAPGALLTVLSGLILTFQVSERRSGRIQHLADADAGRGYHRRPAHAAHLASDRDQARPARSHR